MFFDDLMRQTLLHKEGVFKLQHSKLEEHKFKRGKFITPWNDMIGDKGKMQSWSLERLPEYIWIGLIFKKYGRRIGLEKCYLAVKKLKTLDDKINVPAISKIFLMAEKEQEEYWSYLRELIGNETLSPLTVIYTYRRQSVFNKIFHDDKQDYANKLSIICKVLKDGFDGHSHFAADIRFVVLYFSLLQGRLSVPEHVLNTIIEYPKLEYDDEMMRLVRPTIRSMEMTMLEMDPTNKHHLQEFWERISEMSDCENFYIEYVESADNAESYIEYLCEIFEYLSQVFVTTEPLNEKYLVILGISTYAYKRVNELVEHNLYNEISGRSIIRNIIEDYIMLKYLQLHESEHTNIWNEFQYYGIGLYKLIMTRERANPCSLDGSHVNYRLLELLVNEYQDEEFINMDTSYFDKQNIRIKAKEVGEEELYGLFYDYDSSFEHGLWGAVRESALLKCNSPAHQYHCVPDYANKQKLPSVWSDCVRVMNKILEFMNEYITIPEILLNEVKRFEK
jgi:hypothetical protein